MLDKHDCYELCVQSPRHVVSLLRALHGNEPIVLREDFCGTAAVARRWCEEARARGEPARAWAADLDVECMTRAREHSRAAGIGDMLTTLHADLLADEHGGGMGVGMGEGADVVFVGNFSIGYARTRESLLAYLRRCKRHLDLGLGGFGGGVFVCDTYGGASAFALGGLERRHPSRGREVVHYVWQHEAADPTTSMVRNSIGFRVELEGEIVAEYPRAFVYEWRLWSIAELREAMRDAGFVRTAVYQDLNLAPGQPAVPVSDEKPLGADWIVAVAGWV